MEVRLKWKRLNSPLNFPGDDNWEMNFKHDFYFSVAAPTSAYAPLRFILTSQVEIDWLPAQTAKYRDVSRRHDSEGRFRDADYEVCRNTSMEADLQ